MPTKNGKAQQDETFDGNTNLQSLFHPNRSYMMDFCSLASFSKGV